MVDDGASREDATMVSELRPEIQIHVLAVGNEVFVEQADLVEQGSAIRRGAATGAEHLERVVELAPIILPNTTISW